MSGDAFAALLPEVAVPRLPFLGAYAIRVQSLPALEALLLRQALASRRLGATLLVPFPPALGIGCWAFAENPADLPWRSR
jgi:hypothetical protein